MLFQIWLRLSLFITPASSGDVIVKCIEHCDIEEWTVNGAAGKDIKLKYILEQEDFHFFVLEYNNLVVFQTNQTTTDIDRKEQHLDFSDTQLVKDDEKYYFTFRVKDLNKTIHQNKSFTSILTLNGKKNETDVLKISVKQHDYVPSMEDNVTMFAGIAMVVLMLALVTLFVVLYRKDTSGRKKGKCEIFPADRYLQGTQVNSPLKYNLSSVEKEEKVDENIKKNDDAPAVSKSDDETDAVDKDEVLTNSAIEDDLDDGVPKATPVLT